MKYRPSFSKIRDTVRNTHLDKKKEDMAKKMGGFNTKKDDKGGIDWKHYQSLRANKEKKGLIT